MWSAEAEATEAREAHDERGGGLRRALRHGTMRMSNGRVCGCGDGRE